MKDYETLIILTAASSLFCCFHVDVSEYSNYSFCKYSSNDAILTTGSETWSLFQDVIDASSSVWTFVVASWKGGTHSIHFLHFLNSLLFYKSSVRSSTGTYSSILIKTKLYLIIFTFDFCFTTSFP